MATGQPRPGSQPSLAGKNIALHSIMPLNALAPWGTLAWWSVMAASAATTGSMPASPVVTDTDFVG